jgi:2-dehydropantoate 2-reductase
MKRCLIVGGGAIGGFFGARLARAARVSLTFLARGQQAEALRQNGLRVISSHGSCLEVDQLHVIESTGELEDRPDLVLVCVKSYDTDGVITSLSGHLGTDSQLLSLQNGIENYPKFAGAFGAPRVVRAYCSVNAGVESPGVIRVGSLDAGEICFGEEDGKSSDRCRSIAATFEEAGIDHRVSQDIRSEVWSKFAFNCIFNMQCLLFRSDILGLHASFEASSLIRKQHQELERLARAEGVRLVSTFSLPSVPRTIAAKLYRAVVRRARPRTAIRLSTVQDYERGKRLETDAFIGACIRLAEKHGLDVPVTRKVAERLVALDQNPH